MSGCAPPPLCAMGPIRRIHPRNKRRPRRRLGQHPPRYTASVRRRRFDRVGPRALGVAGVAISIALAVSAGVLWPPEVSAPPVRDHVFRNVTLVEPGLPRVPGATLVLSEGRIAAAGSDDPAGVTGDGDFEGLFALPGLVDPHVHHPPRIAIGGRGIWLRSPAPTGGGGCAHRLRPVPPGCRLPSPVLRYAAPRRASPVTRA